MYRSSDPAQSAWCHPCQETATNAKKDSLTAVQNLDRSLYRPIPHPTSSLPK